jgi:hypothetical protein
VPSRGPEGDGTVVDVMTRGSAQGDGAPQGRRLVAVPRPSAPTAAARGRAARDRAVYEVTSSLCARLTSGGHIIEGASHHEVTSTLRDLLPFLDDAEVDRFMTKLGRAADFVSMTERVDPSALEDYSDAAVAAGLDPTDFPPDPFELGDDPDSHQAFHAAVIQYWDLALREVARQMLAENDRRDPAPVEATGRALSS